MSQFEDVASLLILRLFAKRKQGLISESDFERLSEFGVKRALITVTTKQNARDLEELVVGELRKTLELVSQRSCGKCKGRGLMEYANGRIIVCTCVHLVNYRGDSALPLGDQWSNEYFQGEFSKMELGQKGTVVNIANAVRMFLG